MTPALILASASPRRKEILQRLNLEFSVHSVDADESLDPEESRHPALYIAERKARLAHELYPDGWIIACDTVVELPASLSSRSLASSPGDAVADPRYLGKAADATEARRMLSNLSGGDHFVRTAHVVVSREGRFESEVTTTRVRFRDLDANTLDWYIRTEDWKDKAGAYGIQGPGCLLVDEIQGDYLNVVGLSPVTLDRIFACLGLRLLDFQKTKKLSS